MFRAPSVTMDSRAGISVMFESCQNRSTYWTAMRQAGARRAGCWWAEPRNPLPASLPGGALFVCG